MSTIRDSAPTAITKDEHIWIPPQHIPSVLAHVCSLLNLTLILSYCYIAVMNEGA